MAWDPPTPADAAAKGRHCARILRHVLEQKGEEWASLSPDDRLERLSDLLPEVTRFLGHPGMGARLADDEESWELAERGRGVEVVAGEAISPQYYRAFEDAVAQVRKALEARGLDTEAFDPARARDGLPQAEAMDRMLRGEPAVEGLAIDPAMLERGLEQTPILMEAIVERAAERVDDLDIATQARSLSVACAQGFAEELGVDYSALDAEPAALITMPRIVDAREASREIEEVRQARDALPEAVENGRAAMSSLEGLIEPAGPDAWGTCTTYQRLGKIEPAIKSVRRALDHSQFDVELADGEQQQMLRASRRVAQMIPEETSLTKHRDIFEVTKAHILDELEAQGLERGWIDPGQITPSRSPRQVMVVDVENLAGDVGQVPFFIQGVTEELAESAGHGPAEARRQGVAFGYGASLQAGTSWTPAEFGPGGVADLPPLESWRQEADRYVGEPGGDADHGVGEARGKDPDGGVDEPRPDDLDGGVDGLDWDVDDGGFEL